MKFLLALALTCILSISTVAGEIPSGGKASAPPDSTQKEIPSTAINMLITFVNLLTV